MRFLANSRNDSIFCGKEGKQLRFAQRIATASPSLNNE
jgi:hypothetical protein